MYSLVNPIFSEIMWDNGITDKKLNLLLVFSDGYNAVIFDWVLAQSDLLNMTNAVSRIRPRCFTGATVPGQQYFSDSYSSKK